MTMSAVAERAGIGRATLYKYFADVESILLAYHDGHVAQHLEQLRALRNAGEPATALKAVMNAYATMCRDRTSHGSKELVSLLHRGQGVDRVEAQLLVLLQALVEEASVTHDVRDDVPPEELAAYCLHALGAASELSSEAAVHRLVDLTLAGLRPSPSADSPSTPS